MQSTRLINHELFKDNAFYAIFELDQKPNKYLIWMICYVGHEQKVMDNSTEDHSLILQSHWNNVMKAQGKCHFVHGYC